MKSVILGTAQWGFNYGVTNATGRLSDRSLKALAGRAWKHGIRSLDTAPSYGDAESRVGLISEPFEVQTKVSALDCEEPALFARIQEGRRRTHQPELAAVLVHDWPELPARRQGEVARIMESVREGGLCHSVGVSVYEEADIRLALKFFSRLDVVQAPVSILDQRLAKSEAVRRLRSRGGRLQARSVLLQGAAAAPSEHPMFGHHPDVSRLRASGNPVKLCMSYIAGLPWVDEVVVAATSVGELDELMANLRSPMVREDWADFASQDPWLIDPRRWTAPTQKE